MHQSRFRAPDPAGGAHSAPPDLLARYKGPTSKGSGERDKGWGREMKERDGKDRGRGGRIEGRAGGQGIWNGCLLLNGGLVTPLATLLISPIIFFCHR